MGNIIASQLNLNTDQAFSGAVILCALSLLTAWATYTFFETGFKEGFHKDDIVVGGCAIIFTIVLIGGAYMLIDQSQTKQNKTNTTLSNKQLAKCRITISKKTVF